jgi:hypothetical protein
MVSGGIRGLLIINTILFGLMLLYILIFSVIVKLPATTDKIILISLVIINVAALLYKSGSSLGEYEKYFSGLGSGIIGCVLSSLGLGILQFLPLSVNEFYAYLLMLVYSLATGVAYIYLNEVYRKERP